MSEVTVQFLIYDDGPNILGDADWDDLFDHWLPKLFFVCFRVMSSYVKAGSVRSIGRKKRKVENEEQSESSSSEVSFKKDNHGNTVYMLPAIKCQCAYCKYSFTLFNHY